MLILLNPFKSQLCILSLIAFFLLFTPLLIASESATKPTSQEFKQRTAKLHMPFIVNNGQMDEQVKFYAKTFGGTVFVTKDGEIVYALPKFENSGDKNQEGKFKIQDDVLCHPECNEGSLVSKRDSSPSAQHDSEAPEIRNPKHVASGVEPSETCGEQRSNHPKSGVALREEFVGSRVKVIQGEEPSVTKVSYFKGNDPSKWKTNISTYDAVNLGEIYDGIELKLRAYGNNIEKLFCVKPGANPKQIKIRLSGVKGCGVQKAEITHPLVPSREGINPKSKFQNLSPAPIGDQKLQVNNAGELEVETELGLVKFTKPVAYQEIEGKRVEVDVVYNISNPKSAIQNPKFEYGFKVASYDRTKDLIIDPLLASTYLGGSKGWDGGYSLTLDTSGNVYVTGYTYSTDFPTTSGAYDTSYNDSGDVFVSKLNAGLTSLLASTYLGGSGQDDGYSLALDTSGNVYVAGRTGSSFPTTSGAYDTSFNSSYGSDVFVSKLNSGLTSLLASTYLGGTDSDYCYSLALDTSGNVYVTGYTYSADFPTTLGAYDTSFNGSYDVFVSKLNSRLTSLLASTFLGGSSIDFNEVSIALDTSGDVFVTGLTGSTDFPTTSGAYNTSYNGGNDVFVSKLDGGLTTLLASTYLGGTSSDIGSSLALGTSGDAYVTGYTHSTDFPTTLGAYDTSFNGGYEDVFVSKLNSGLTSLLASTYLGGSDYDYGYSLALDTSGNVYVTGHTYSIDFPHTSGVYNTSYNGGGDVFVSKLDGKLSADDSTCKADNIDVDPGDIEVQTGDSADETITITCADTVTPVSGEKVKAKVKFGKDKVTVSPGSAVTDENGLTVFTIQGIKKGKAKIIFTDTEAELKVKVKVKVIK